MKNFHQKLPSFNDVLQISMKPPIFKESAKKGPIFREFRALKPFYEWATYSDLQRVIYPPPFQVFLCAVMQKLSGVNGADETMPLYTTDLISNADAYVLHWLAWKELGGFAF